MFAQQEQMYSQISFCDGVLRKQDDMIIHLTVLSVRDDTREADSRDMRYCENSWLSLPDVEKGQILPFIESVYQSLSQQKEQLQCDDLCLEIFGLGSRILCGEVKTETVHDTCNNSKKNKNVKERVKLEGDEMDHDDGHCNGGDDVKEETVNYNDIQSVLDLGVDAKHEAQTCEDIVRNLRRLYRQEDDG